MRTIFARNRTMTTITPSHTLTDAKRMAGDLVRRAEYRSGSRMSAYEYVGKAVGGSGSWLRKLISSQPVTLHAHQYLNISRLYARLCASIEASAAAADLEAAEITAEAAVQALEIAQDMAGRLQAQAHGPK